MKDIAEKSLFVIPENIKSRCTGFEEGSFRDDISSTELRLEE